MRPLEIISLGLRNLPLLIAALFWVSIIRAGLWFTSYKDLRSRFLPSREFLAPEPRRGAKIAWAVHHAARLVPQATCLTQALAAQIMLSRWRIPTMLHIGVDAREAGAFEAHAWLMLNEAVVLGGTRASLSRYKTIAIYGPAA